MTKDTPNKAMAKFLEAAAHFPEGGAKAVDDAVAQLMLQPDKCFIGPLLMTLDDSFEEDGAMFSLIHAAEQFDDNVYIDEMLAILPQFCAGAPKWASIAFMRCLNNAEMKNYMVKAIRQSSIEIKEAVIWLCNKINERNPIFLNKTLLVLLSAK
jgi:Immunity protein 30